MLGGHHGGPGSRTVFMACIGGPVLVPRPSIFSAGDLIDFKGPRLRFLRAGLIGELSGRSKRTPSIRLLLAVFIGGPGRTRTCNQTVMSGKGDPENTEDI